MPGNANDPIHNHEEVLDKAILAAFRLFVSAVERAKTTTVLGLAKVEEALGLADGVRANGQRGTGGGRPGVGEGRRGAGVAMQGARETKGRRCMQMHWSCRRDRTLEAAERSQQEPIGSRWAIFIRGPF